MHYLRKWLIATALLLISGLACATHIRSIDIQWSVPDPVNSPLKVQIVVTEVGRASYPWPNPPIDAQNVAINNAASINIANVPITLSKVGDGVDAANGVGGYDGNYIVLRGTVVTTLPALGNYQASVNSCCTASNMANGNNDASYGAVAKIVLDGQRGGPVAAVQPIINLTRGSLQTVRFPMFDPDGDPVSCRFATSAEAFSLPTPIPKVGSVQATISTIGNECELSWNLTGVGADSFHFLPLIIESTHNGKISSIGVDRMLLVTNKSYPACTGGGYIGLQPNQVFSTQFVGTASSNLSFAVTGAPIGSTFTPASGTSGSSPMSVDFSWTPTPAQAGSSYIMQAVFKDASNVEGQCNYVVNVDALNPVLSLNAIADVPNGTAAQLSGHVTNRTSGSVEITLTDSLSQTHVVPATISSSGDWQAPSPTNLPVGAVQISVALQGFAVLPATGSFNVLAVSPILTGSAPSGQVGSAFSFTPNVGPANVTLPVTFALTGTLPNGLNFNATTGAIAGTPEVAGSFPVAIEATNSGGNTTLILTLVINQISTATALTLPSGLTVGQMASFSVAVTAASGVPTGSVAISSGTESCNATLSGGIGNCQFIPTNASNSVQFTAVYSGDTNSLSSQDMKVASIAKAAQNISFTTTAPVGAKVGDVYNVAATGGASGNNVTFSIDSSTASNCSIAGSTVTLTNASNCIINANQLGNTNYLDASQAQQTIGVGKAAQSITLTSAVPSNAKVGGSYLISATGGLSGNPVTFTVDGASASICSIAGSTVTFNATGACTINANQQGNANYNDAAQVQQVVPVAQGGTGVTVTSSVNPSKPGQSVTFTISVAFDSSKSASMQKATPVPTGTIELADGNNSLGTVALVNGTATVSTTQLTTVGSHSIVASYSGDTNFPPEKSLAFTQEVVSAVVTPVPTLGQWALMLLSVVLAGFAATSLRRARLH